VQGYRAKGRGELMCDKKSFGDTELGQLLGAALIILSICLGVGGCLCLAGSDGSEPVISITTEETK